MLELLPANWAGAPYIFEHLVRYVTPTLHGRVCTCLISRASPSFSSSTVICNSLWRIPRSTSQVFSASREIHVISSAPFPQQPLTLLRCPSASHCAASHCHLVYLAYRHDSRCKERPALGSRWGEACSAWKYEMETSTVGSADARLSENDPALARTRQQSRTGPTQHY